MDLNIAATLLLATINYLLLLQVTRFSPTNEQYPLVDFLSPIDRVQYAYDFNIYFYVLFKVNPSKFPSNIL